MFKLFIWLQSLTVGKSFYIHTLSVHNNLYLFYLPRWLILLSIYWQERLEYIEMDQREYTLEVEDMKMQEVIMKPEPSKDDTIILTKNLSCSYPRVPINEAIQKENEKLQLELQHSQANLDVGQCEFIQHLLDVTEVVATNTLSLRNSPAKPLKKLDQSYSNVDNEKIYYEDYAKSDEKQSTSR